MYTRSIMAKKKNEYKVKLKSIVVECDKLAEKIPHSFGKMTIKADKLIFDGLEHDNNHGSVVVTFKCLCGDIHQSIIEEW